MKHSTLWQTTHRSRIPSVQSFFSPFIFGKKYLPQNYFFWYRYIWLQVISSFPLIFRWLNIYACFFSIKFPENKKNHPTLPPPSPTKKKNTTETTSFPPPSLSFPCSPEASSAWAPRGSTNVDRCGRISGPRAAAAPPWRAAEAEAAGPGITMGSADSRELELTESWRIWGFFVINHTPINIGR